MLSPRWLLATAALGGACGRFGFASSPTSDGALADSPDGAPTTIDATPIDTPDAALPPNFVFVTSTSPSACASGLVTADAACNARATAAALPGTYVAWMSSATIDARTRLGSARGWVRTDGKPFADTITSLLDDGTVFYPARLDEFGNDLGETFTETASNADGTYASNGCGVGGLPSFGGFGWSTGIVVGNGRLTCFETDHATPVTLTPATGRIAFVTTGLFDPSSGVATADALCTSEATAASLPGSYLAFLPTTTVTAPSRFDLGGAPWVRTDGVAIVASASDVTAWSLLAGIERHHDGSLANTRVWTGRSPTTGGSTCTSWTSSAPTGATTDAADSVVYGGSVSAACTQALPVYCFEQ